jgi:hypothetical protein
MAMIVAMMIGGNEQSLVFRVGGDLIRVARTTNVLIQANDFIASSHNEMEVVRYKQYTTPAFIPYPGNKMIEFFLTQDIHPLHRLIQHKQVRFRQ